MSGTRSSGGGLVLAGVIAGGTDTRVLFQDGTGLGQAAAFTFAKTTGLLKATTLALGGATIGTHALAVTGTANVSSGANLGGSTISLANDGTASTNGARLWNGGVFAWSSNTNSTGSADLTLSRSAAGILQVGTTAANALGSLNLTNLAASGYVKYTPAATTPSTPEAGWVAAVNTATAPAIGSALSLGGAAFALAVYNGAQWTVIGV